MKAILALARMAYKLILRDLLKNAIDDPAQEWDDIVLKALDAVFGYDED